MCVCERERYCGIFQHYLLDIYNVDDDDAVGRPPKSNNSRKMTDCGDFDRRGNDRLHPGGSRL